MQTSLVDVLRQRLKWKSFFACFEAKKIGTESVYAAQIIYFLPVELPSLFPPHIRFHIFYIIRKIGIANRLFIFM